MISAPLLDDLIIKAQANPELLTLANKGDLLVIIAKLQCVAICGNDERRELWLTEERGSIEDYGDYNEYLENGIVNNEEDFERVWKEDYPDPVKWYPELIILGLYRKELCLFIVIPIFRKKIVLLIL